MQPNPEGVQEPPAGSISTSNWDCTATSLAVVPVVADHMADRRVDAREDCLLGCLGACKSKL